jgi:hypothetical protein
MRGSKRSNLMKNTNTDSVEAKTLYLQKCKINPLQRLLQNTYNSSTVRASVEAPSDMQCWITSLHCVQMIIHHQIQCPSKMFKFLEQHIMQVVTSGKEAVECYRLAKKVLQKKCSVFCVIVNINDHFTNTGELCTYDPAGS